MALPRWVLPPEVNNNMGQPLITAKSLHKCYIKNSGF